MKHPALEFLVTAARSFSFLDRPPVFFGGATVPLYLADEACLDAARSTEDVDLVVELVSESLREGLEMELVRHGFVEDERPGAPPCRWIRGGLRYDNFDAQQMDPNDWARPGRGRVVEHPLDGHRIRASSC